MFLGEFECKIDNKHRIIIPSSFRKELVEVVVTYIDENTLVVKNANNWTPESVLDGASISSDKLKSHLLYIEYNSETVKVDSQGRIVIPLNFMNRLLFSEEVIVVGKRDNFTILNKEKYIEELNRISGQWQEFLESNEGRDFKASLIFKKK